MVVLRKLAMPVAGGVPCVGSIFFPEGFIKYSIIFRIVAISLQKLFFPQKVKHIPHVIITDITKESTKLYIHPMPVNEIKY